MSVVFCTSCGHKIEFAGAKPNFCSSCGFSFSGETVVAKTVATKREPSENSDETNYEYVPSVAKLEYDCDFGGPHKIHTLADLLNESIEKNKPSPQKIKKARRPAKE